MFIFTSLQTASNFWLSYWSDGADHPEHSQGFYLEIYLILSISYVSLCFLRITLLNMQSLRCSRQIHKDMLTKIIRAPVNLFFDRVPVGRILNRLTKDLTMVDSFLASALGSVAVMFFMLAANIFVCMVVGSAWTFPLSIVFFIVSYKIQRIYMGLNREVTRLGK